MDTSCFCIKEGELLSSSPKFECAVMVWRAVDRCVWFLGSRLYRRAKIRAIGRDDDRKGSQGPLSQENELKIGGQTEIRAMDSGLPVLGRQVQE